MPSHTLANLIVFLGAAVSKKQHIQTIKFNRCCDQLITFDVTKLVQKWKLYPDSNHGILLELTDELGNKFNVDDYIQTMNCAGRSPSAESHRCLIENDLIESDLIEANRIEGNLSRKAYLEKFIERLVERAPYRVQLISLLDDPLDYPARASRLHILACHL